jgi:hypothetical protein
MRSSRLTTSLTTCSGTSTPRTADPHDLVYEEAKRSLASCDTEVAISLLHQCPRAFKNVERYRKQCVFLQRLCDSGLVQRRQTAGLRHFLSNVLRENEDSLVISKYAELLYEVGYTTKALEAMSLDDVDTMFSVVTIPKGFQLLFRIHYERRSSPCARLCYHLHRHVEKCGGARLLLRRYDAARRASSALEEEEEDTASDENV